MRAPSCTVNLSRHAWFAMLGPRQNAWHRTEGGVPEVRSARTAVIRKSIAVAQRDTHVVRSTGLRFIRPMPREENSTCARELVRFNLSHLSRTWEAI